MADFICSECHYIGKPRKKKRGSTGLEIFMWLIFPFGLPYSFWRMLSKTSECRHCASNLLVPLDSPMGERLLSLYEESISKGRPVTTKVLETPSVLDKEFVEKEEKFSSKTSQEARVRKSHQDTDAW